MTKTKKKHKKSTSSLNMGASDLFDVLSTKSYFDLSVAEKQLIRQTLACEINGWSFVPNPEVVLRLQRSREPLVRYILFIETLRAGFYFAIKKFLKEQRINVNSYYTGGSADFICDIHATEDGCKDFCKELENVLVGAGKIKDVKNLIAVFRVESPIILCGQMIADLGKVDPGTMKEIEDDPAKFETVYRDYRSEEAKKMFASDRALNRYLSDLKEAKAIVGFRALFDNCRVIDHEYVPLCHGRALNTLLQKGGEVARLLLGPVIELLKVSPVRPTDEAEEEVTHIFVNEYDFPGQRNDWRTAVYDKLGDELNVFTFPLEGTLNETPVVFSDLPEAIAEARQYVGNIPLGFLSHPSARRDQYQVCVQQEALAAQGLTLGRPGNGKTSTDCVLLTGLCGKLKRIVIVDHSRSIRGKEAKLPEEVRKRIQYVNPKPAASKRELEKIIQSCVGGDIFVVEVSMDAVPRFFELCLKEIGKSTENAGKGPRVVSNLLLVEEANDALGKGNERKKLVSHLETVLTKAYRWGWCVWISTQQPSHLGYDEASAIQILRLLQYRILHEMKTEDVTLLKAAIPEDGADKKLEETLSLVPGEAIVFGHYTAAGSIAPLPPVRVQVNQLGVQ